MTRFLRRPSPAMIVAIIALIAALGGSAIAAGVLSKKKVKNISKNVADKQITARAPSLAVASAKSADSLGPVTIKRFFFQAAPNTADAVIGTFGPMTLKATCDGSGIPTLRASWNEDVNQLTFNGFGASLTGTSTVSAGTTIGIGTGAAGSVGLTEAIAYGSKTQTSVEYFLRPAPALGSNQCFYSGFVTTG